MPNGAEIVAAVRANLSLVRTHGRVVATGVDRVHEALGLDPRDLLGDDLEAIEAMEAHDLVHRLVRSAVNHAEAS